MEEKGAQLQVESWSRKFAGIAVFLRAALDRAAKVTQVWLHGGSHKTNSRWRNIRQGGVC
jgi:hypothetical protein